MPPGAELALMQWLPPGHHAVRRAGCIESSRRRSERAIVVRGRCVNAAVPGSVSAPDCQPRLAGIVPQRANSN